MLTTLVLAFSLLVVPTPVETASPHVYVWVFHYGQNHSGDFVMPETFYGCSDYGGKKSQRVTVQGCYERHKAHCVPPPSGSGLPTMACDPELSC